MAKPRQLCGEGWIPSTPRSDTVAWLNEMIAGFVDLDVNGLRLQWRNHLGGTPPAHLPRWLLLKILAYRNQAAALGGLDKETLRVIRQPKGQTLDSHGGSILAARSPATRDGINLRAGAVLARKWNGTLERVMVLEKGFAWNGETYSSLSQIAKAMTGTSWNGHRFFGLRTAKSDRYSDAGLSGGGSDLVAPSDVAWVESTGDGAIHPRRVAARTTVARAARGGMSREAGPA